MILRATVILLLAISAAITEEEQYHAVLTGTKRFDNHVVGYLQFTQANSLEACVMMAISVDVRSANLQNGAYFLTVHKYQTSSDKSNDFSLQYQLGDIVPLVEDQNSSGYLMHVIIMFNGTYERSEPFCYATLSPDAPRTLVNRVIALYAPEVVGTEVFLELLASGLVVKKEGYRDISDSESEVSLEEAPDYSSTWRF